MHRGLWKQHIVKQFFSAKPDGSTVDHNRQKNIRQPICTGHQLHSLVDTRCDTGHLFLISVSDIYYTHHITQINQLNHHHDKFWYWLDVHTPGGGTHLHFYCMIHTQQSIDIFSYTHFVTHKHNTGHTAYRHVHTTPFRYHTHIILFTDTVAH